MPESTEGLNSQLKLLKAAYAARLPSIAAQLEQAWSALRANWNEAACAELHRVVHSITGSGATFGYASLSDTARKLEAAIAESAAAGARATDDRLGLTDALVGELLDAVRAAASQA